MPYVPGNCFPAWLVWCVGAVKPEARAEGMRCGFRWSDAYSLSLRFGLPGSGAGWPHRQRRRFSGAERIEHDFTACWPVR